jgi:hypothetical protein
VVIGKNPNILVYEASEGSLGILSQIVENTLVLPDLLSTAWRICR